jgi:hypothetical protein
MRILVHCTKCLQYLTEKGDIPADGSFDSSLVNFLANYGDDFVARGRCPRGHDYIGYITKERYDVLYESAVLSYLMGFELEAVLGFAASLERAQELFTITSLRSGGLELVTINDMWKQVTRQSERQLGAFLVQWLLTTKGKFEIQQSMTEFRNKVIHRGHIPLREETKVYASWVNDRLFDIVEVLRQWSDGPLKDLQNIHVSGAHSGAVTELKRLEPAVGYVPLVSINPPYLTLLHMHESSFKRTSFDEVCVMARKSAKHRGIDTTVF